MPDELTKPPMLGKIRSLLCPMCTERNKTPMRRQHVYGEVRTVRHVECSWQCTACGHKIPVEDEITRKEETVSSGRES